LKRGVDEVYKRKRIGFFIFVGLLVGMIVHSIRMNEKIMELKDHARKMHEFYSMLVSWLAIMQRGMSLEIYFQRKGYRSVAIYGMKEIGERLYQELQNSNIVVKYAIDQNADNIYTKCEVLNPEEELEDVDVIIVTAIHFFDDIKEKLCKKMDCPIVSIADIVQEIESRG
jgi:hypothetical protein